MVNRLIYCLLVCLLVFSCQEKEVLFEEGWEVEVSGSTVYVKEYAIGHEGEDVSQREPIIVVHGGPVLDHTYFIPHLDELARTYQLIFYDQRVCGRSSLAVDTATMTLDGFADDIEVIRKQMGLGKVNLLGHSWGGLVAMKYAIKYDEQLSHLILSNSMAPSVADWQADNAAVAQMTSPKDQQRLNALVSSGLLRQEKPARYIKEMMMLSFRGQMYDTAKLSKLEIFIPENFMIRSQTFGLLSPDLASYNLYQALTAVKTPTLIIYGEKEPAVGGHAGRFAEAFPNATLEVISKSGHFPFIESPETYANAVSGFIKK